LTLFTIHSIRNERAQAKESLGQAIALFDRLHDEFPNDATFRRKLAKALVDQGELLEVVGKGESVRAALAYNRALKLWGDDVAGLADAHFHLGMLYARLSPDDHSRASIAGFAAASASLPLPGDGTQGSQANEHIGQVFKIIRAIPAEKRDVDTAVLLAKVLNCVSNLFLGELFRHLLEGKDPRELWVESVAILQPFMKHPDMTQDGSYEYFWAANNTAINFNWMTDDGRKAYVEHWKKAMPVLEHTARVWYPNVKASSNYEFAMARLGMTLKYVNLPEAVECYDRLLAWRQKVQLVRPPSFAQRLTDADYQVERAECLSMLKQNDKALRAWEDAEQALADAIAGQKKFTVNDHTRVINLGRRLLVTLISIRPFREANFTFGEPDSRYQRTMVFISHVNSVQHGSITGEELARTIIDLQGTASELRRINRTMNSIYYLNRAIQLADGTTTPLQLLGLRTQLMDYSLELRKYPETLAAIEQLGTRIHPLLHLRVAKIGTVVATEPSVPKDVSQRARNLALDHYLQWATQMRLHY